MNVGQLRKIVASLNGVDDETPVIMQLGAEKFAVLVDVDTCFWDATNKEAFSKEDEDVDPAYCVGMLLVPDGV